MSMKKKLGALAVSAEQQIGGEAEQAVAAARTAALNRFQQEIATPGFDQLERRQNRRFGIRDDAAPDERAAPVFQRKACGLIVH